MLYGLSGSAGTGKTTLCKAVSEALDITFMPTSITECARRHGFDAVGVLSLRERLELQNHLLNDHLEMIQQAKRPLIVDRTPIDMIGYLLCEFSMNSHLLATAEEIAATEDYVQRCLRAVKENYDFVFLVGQLDHYEVAPTRPADNRAYQTHSQLVMEGALIRLGRQINSAFIRQTDHGRRVEYVTGQIVKRLDAIEQERRSSPHIH